MPDLVVDVEGLRRLAQSLAMVKEGLEDTRATIDRNESALGSAKVVDALSEFEDNWDDGRGRVVKNIEGVVGPVEESAAAYEQTDQDLADGLRTNEGSGPGPQAV